MIANIILGASAQQATIYADTAPAGASNVLLLPHLGAAVTGRCDPEILLLAVSLLQGLGDDFDVAVAALAAGRLSRAARAARMAYAGIGRRQHLAVVGWSLRAARYRVMLLAQDGGNSFRATGGADRLTLPWDDEELGPAPPVACDAHAVQLAQLQRRYLAAIGEDPAAGGRLHRARLEAGGASMAVDVVHSFDPTPDFAGR